MCIYCGKPDNEAICPKCEIILRNELEKRRKLKEDVEKRLREAKIR